MKDNKTVQNGLAYLPSGEPGKKAEKILYLECASGISGDMTVAALLDLGADESRLREALASLPLDGYDIHISRVKKSGLDACDFAVRLDAEHENHDHDMAYLHGDMQVHNHEGHSYGHDEHSHDHDGYSHGHGEHSQNHDEHSHGHDAHSHNHDAHSHDHDGHNHDYDEHSHDHGGHNHDYDGHNHSHDDENHNHHHHHEHRGLPEIRAIIDAGSLTSGAKEIAYRIFDILADAEAKAHGVPRDQVHFHEVGAVDSIVDIVAAAVCLDDLAADRIVISPLSEGNGTVRCQHGVLPIPVPAVANIVAAHGLAIHRTTVEGELVTPTGAAIAAALMQVHNSLPESYTVRGVGIGAGKRDYATVGIMRAMWVVPVDARRPAEVSGIGADESSGSSAARTKSDSDKIVKLEANIDDATGEELGHCMDCLFEAGARDVSFIPLYMKKNRPAYELHVICMPQDVSRMEEILFRETTTIGIRRVWMERTVMERTSREVETAYGTALVKECRYGQLRKVYPEYESVALLCRESGEDYRKVYQAIVNCAEKSS